MGPAHLILQRPRYSDGEARNCCDCYRSGRRGTDWCASVAVRGRGRTNQRVLIDQPNFQRNFLEPEPNQQVVEGLDAVSTRIYKSAGGCYNQSDARGVAVPMLYRGTKGVYGDASSATGIIAGIVQDSGIAERTKNLYAMGCVSSSTVRGTDADLDLHKRIIQISYPVPVPPCNPWRGYPLPATCPYKNCPLAIPHFSAGGLDFLFEDFEIAFLRYLGTGSASSANQDASAGYGNTVQLNTSTEPVLIKYVDKSAQLEIKYFRLSHAQSVPLQRLAGADLPGTRSTQ